MSETLKLNRKAKFMLIIELIIFFGFFLVYFWLRSVIIGIFYIVFIISLFIWLIAIVLTLIIYNNTRQNNDAK